MLLSAAAVQSVWPSTTLLELCTNGAAKGDVVGVWTKNRVVGRREASLVERLIHKNLTAVSELHHSLI